jgi:hypothetical protein
MDRDLDCVGDLQALDFTVSVALGDLMSDIQDGSGFGQLDVSSCSMKVHIVHHEGKASFILPQYGQQVIQAWHDQSM